MAQSLPPDGGAFGVSGDPLWLRGDGASAQSAVRPSSFPEGAVGYGTPAQFSTAGPSVIPPPPPRAAPEFGRSVTLPTEQVDQAIKQRALELLASKGITVDRLDFHARAVVRRLDDGSAAVLWQE